MTSTHRLAPFVLCLALALAACKKDEAGKGAAPPAPTLAAALAPGELPASPAEDKAVAAFWAWWAEAKPRFAKVSELKDPAPLQDELDAKVKLLHPDLTWEVGREPDGRSFLLVSGEGRFPLRKLTDRWARAAPKDDWRYRPARLPRPDALQLTLEFEEKALDLKSALYTFTADKEKAVLDVAVYHPVFAQLSPDARGAAAVVVLDTFLGEDDVERWIGAITELHEAPREPKTIKDVRDAMATLPAVAGAFTLRKGQTQEGELVTAALRLGLKRLDYLHHGWHLEVSIPMQDASAAAALETELVEAIGPAAIHYGHLVRPGRLNVLFFAAARAPVERVLETWMKGHAGQQMPAAWVEDPEWQRLRQFQR